MIIRIIIIKIVNNKDNNIKSSNSYNNKYKYRNKYEY